MGLGLVLSLRLPPLYGTSGVSFQKALLEPATDSPRRRRPAVAAEAHSNPEGSSDWKFHGALDNHRHHPHHHHSQNHHQQFNHQYQFLHQAHEHHHHTQHYPCQGSLDAGRQPGRLGTGFSIASERDVGEEKQECASSLLLNGKCVPFSFKGVHIAINSVCAEGAATGVNLPLSLRMLKRKQQDCALVSGLSEVGNSLLKAFSSVVSMMKALQSHTLHIRRQFFEQEIEGLLNQAQKEMHVSLLWLFQQVFACTPELMVLVMVLLADFTAFSLVNNTPVQLPAPLYAPPVSIVSLLSNNTEFEKGVRGFFNMSLKSSPSIADNGLHNSNGGWVGNGGRGIYHIAGNADEDPDHTNSMVNLNKVLYTMDDQFPAELSSTTSMASHDVSFTQYGLPPPNDQAFAGDDSTASEFSAMAAAMAFEELAAVDDTSNNISLLPTFNSDNYNAVSAMEEEIAKSSNYLVLDQATKQNLVAPLTARIEDDNYACYDKTDLSYQDAISNDSNNSLLLTNYAQFLFLVRKDHDRAEELFRKAILCNPFDCDALSRFASFLWLARQNLGAAEKAYQAASRAEPANSFHAANYAHFLWNSGL